MSVYNLYCGILGKVCIKKECAQWTDRGCLLHKRLGNFLYSSMSPIDLAAFIRYIEEIRPDEKQIKEETIG